MSVRQGVEEELQHPHPPLDAAGFAHELALSRPASPQRLGKLLEEYRPYLLAIARQEISPQLAGKVGPLGSYLLDSLEPCAATSAKLAVAAATTMTSLLDDLM